MTRLQAGTARIVSELGMDGVLSRTIQGDLVDSAFRAVACCRGRRRQGDVPAANGPVTGLDTRESTTRIADDEISC
jgi:hypothetical protein